MSGGPSFGLSGLSVSVPIFTAPAFDLVAKNGAGRPRDLGQIRQFARQPKVDPVDDPHPFGFLHGRGLQLLRLGADPARLNLVGSGLRGGREEVDLHEC